MALKLTDPIAEKLDVNNHAKKYQISGKVVVSLRLNTVTL